MRTTLCALGAGCLLAGSLTAQSPAAPFAPQLTLVEARAIARRASPELAAARHALEAADGQERQAAAFRNPTIGYGREQTSRDGETTWQNIVTLDQPLEIGGQRGARREAAKFLRAAAEARLAAATAGIDYEVARSYAAAVAAERRAALADAAVGAFGKAQRVSLARLAGGDVSGYQNRRIQLEAARYSALQLEALMARDSAVRMLASLLGPSDSVAANRAIVLVDTLLPPPVTLGVDALVAQALAARPEIRVAEAESQAGLAGVRLASAEQIPTPVLSGGFKNERLTGGETLNGFIAGVTVDLPIWNRRGGAVQAARAEAGRRAAEIEVLRRQTVRDVRTAFEAEQALAGQLAALNGQLGGEAAKARRAAEAAYTEGEITLLEWLDSVRAYQEAETAYITLWAAYIARRAALERATGATLF